MDLAHLHGLIEQSSLLSPPERSYWLGAYASMTPEQQEKLEHILTEGEKLKLEPAIKNYFSVVARMTPPAV